jgi:glycosyltransferase involved in cell wall biosynthesis
MPRGDYLAEIAHAEVAVLLPLIAEGFYLPALEAMALGVPVVTLDAVGNRAYLVPGENAIVPAPDAEDVADAVHALLVSPDRRAALIEAGRRTAGPCTLAGEQAQFSSLLGRTSPLQEAPQR